MKNILKYLHGEHITKSDLLITYVAASSLLALIFGFGFPTGISTMKVVCLCLIILDFSGGVIANLSASTSAFYARKPRLRKFFILAHLIQPVFLIWIFQQEIETIALTVLYTLVISRVVCSLSSLNMQRGLAMFFFLLGTITLLLKFEIEGRILTICLVLYMLKMIFSFPINWSINAAR
jgi:hypothetical protein